MSKLPTKPGFYWWKRSPQSDWEPCEVYFDAYSSQQLKFRPLGGEGEEYPDAQWGGPVSAPIYFERLLWSAWRLFPDANSIYIQYSDNDESSLQEVEAYCIVRSVPHEPMTVYLSAPTIEQLETEIQRRVQNAS